MCDMLSTVEWKGKSADLMQLLVYRQQLLKNLTVRDLHHNKIT